MRTLEEAIGLLKSDIKYNQSIGNDTSCEEQHLGWLEELKAIKDGSIPIILGKAELEMHDKAIRNKSIDDFAEKLKEMSNNSSTNFIRVADYSTNSTNICCYSIDKIAEQLKEGVDNA